VSRAPTPTWNRSLRRAGKVLPGDARRHNRALLLDTLFSAGPHSRADLARHTELTRVTVSEVVNDLLADGLVEELGTRPGQGVGKPATLIGIVPDAAHIVCLDLSDDTAFRGAVVNLAGEVVSRRKVRHTGRAGRTTLDTVVALARDNVAAATAPVLGVGVGTPGVVDAVRGVVLEAPNLQWTDLALADVLHDALQRPVHLVNDANAAALAEHRYGMGLPDRDSLLLIKIGKGVGGGVVLDGHLVVGDRFAAGEIGHVVVDEHGERCACGRYGCLETAIAAPYLRARFAGGDDTRRRDVLADAGRHLGIALAPVVSTLNLHEVVLSAPSDLRDDVFLAAAASTVAQRTMPSVGDHVVVRFGSLGEDDVLLGAATLVLGQELGVA
jgi:predicted NBD/HSP70 family sugar kinase